MLTDEQLIQKIQDGELAPEEALRKFETPFTHISDISLDLDSKALSVGFPSMEEYRYIRKDSPDLIILAARPGMGKTSLLCQIALNASLNGTVALFTLEMTKEQIKNRFMAVFTDRNISKLQYLSEKQVSKFNEELRRHNLMLDDRNGLDINTLISSVKDLNKQQKLDLVVIDYLQIIKTAPGRNRAEEVGIIAERLKSLAKELNVPVLVAAQMNRDVEARQRDTGSFRPMMKDLGESSKIEHWADVILFLHRQHVYDRSRPGEADIFVAKNRHGDLKDLVFEFSATITKFIDKGPKEGDVI